MTMPLEVGEGSASRTGRSLPPGERPGTHCTHTGMRFPDRPARSHSLYRLRYPALPVIAEAFNDHVKTFTQGDTSVNVSTVVITL